MASPQIADREVRRLAELAACRSGGSRQDLYNSVAGLFERRGSRLGPAERGIMLDILERLGQEVEMTVRSHLAERLARQGDAPPELVRLLANDEIQVAQSILTQSSVLQDADLLEVVHQRTTQHRMAIAIRGGLSEAVSAAIVDSGDEDVIVALLNNQDARISSAVLEFLGEQSHRVDAYQNPLVRRPDLPAAVAARMCAWVSDELRRFIVDSFDIDTSQLDNELAATLDELSAGRSPPSDAAAKLAQRLEEAGELSPGLLLRALRQGELALFENGFARLAGLSVALLRPLVYERDDRSFALACRAIDMERGDFLQAYRLTRMRDGGPGRLGKDLTVTLCRLFDEIAPGAARLELRRLQRRADAAPPAP